MQRWKRRLGLLLVTTSFIACASDDDEETPTVDVTAVTYNLGLAVGFVPAAEARTDVTPQEMASLGADILCLQEVWLPDQVAAVQAATTAYPTQIYAEADPGVMGPAACTDADTQPLLDCAVGAGCDQVCSDDLVSCVLDACLAEFGALPPECSTCVQANVGKSLPDIEASCESASTEFAFGGSFGLGLLSRYPVTEQDELVFDSTTNRRATLYALLDTPHGPVHTFCTHLTAVFDTIPYPRATGSWEEEQAAQVAALLEFVDEKAGSDGQVLVLGDMNTGPAGPGYVAEAPDNYAPFLVAGLTNPYVDTPGHTCTFCEDNPLLGNDDDESVVIDHVFLRNLEGATTASRVLDGEIQVEVCDETGPSALSDHYGVSVTISRPAP
ncbi:MAG: endonuclease/exonuclease/phosphatase family protein [Myxococcota bacterium]